MPNGKLKLKSKDSAKSKVANFKVTVPHPFQIIFGNTKYEHAHAHKKKP